MGLRHLTFVPIALLYRLVSFGFQKEEEMLKTKWEYKVVMVSSSTPETILNKLGEEEWELVSVMY